MNIPAEQVSPFELVLIDVGETCRLFGGPNNPLHPATLYRGIKSGKYPRPIKPGPGMSRWVRSECEAVLRQMIEARNAPRSGEAA
jgi:hypothetical protein